MRFTIGGSACLTNRNAAVRHSNPIGWAFFWVSVPKLPVSRANQALTLSCVTLRTVFAVRIAAPIPIAE